MCDIADNRSTNRSMAILLVPGVLICGLCAASSSAAVLYNTTSMTDNNTYTTASQNFIGGVLGTPLGEPWDVQIADDFTLSDNASITGVTADFLALDLALPPAEGILVEFFADVGGAPSDAPTAAVFTSSFSTSNFNNHLGSFAGIRMMVDLSSEGITLNSGDWWMAVTPVDTTASGGRYFQVRDTASPLIGLTAHVRNGGVAHANGFDGGWPDTTGGWSAFGTFGGGAPNAPGDVAMRIDGVSAQLPTPGALALLGLAALIRRRRR